MPHLTDRKRLLRTATTLTDLVLITDSISTKPTWLAVGAEL